MQKAAQYEYTNIRAGNTQMTPNEVVAKINTIFSPLGVEFIGISDETIAMIRNDHMTSGVIDERKAVPPEIAKLFIGLPPSHVRELLRAIQKTNHDPKGRDSMIASAKANRESNGQAFDEIRQTVISTQPLPNDDPNT